MTTTHQPAPATTHTHPKPASAPIMIGCLYALIVSNLIQVFAGLFQIDPSPPTELIPLIAATAALGLAALPMVRDGVRLGYQIGIGFCLTAMIGAGPHKLFLEDGDIIAPMALVGFAFELLFIVHAVRALRSQR